MRNKLFPLLAASILVNPFANAQVYQVTTNAANGAGSLTEAIAQANLGNYTSISIMEGLGTISLTSQLSISSSVTIEGNGAIIDMGNISRAFWIESGTVNLSNFTIQNGLAQGGAGGSGGAGGGGGAGLGGAIYAAGGSISLQNLQFLNNSAHGGAGGSITGGGGGGGGGLTGSGGSATDVNGGTGGGPQGGSAGTGGEADDAGENDSYIGGAGGNGGSYSGGGGGGSGTTEEGFFGTSVGAGGDGGSGSFGSGGGGGGQGHGSTTIFQDGADGGNGGDGGFGAGGGGGGSGGKGTAGVLAGDGGSGGSGGFGAGNGGAGTEGSTFDDGAGGAGGGGLGAGGAVFVSSSASLTIVDGSWNNNSAMGGLGGTSSGNNGGDGMALGSALFLGGNVTYTVSDSNLVTVADSIGGGNDPDAQGSLTKSGLGTLRLTGNSPYTGSTVVNQGTLWVDGGSLVETTQFLVAGSPGDNATLKLTNATVASSIPINLGLQEGSIGTLTLAGEWSDTDVPSVFGGEGGGIVNFETTTSVFAVNTSLEGNLSVNINTSQAVQYNIVGDYSGPTTIISGTLILAVNQNPSSVYNVNGGTLSLPEYQGTLSRVTLQAGVIIGREALLEVDQLTTTSGTIAVTITGNGSLSQEGSGITVLVENNYYTGGTEVSAGMLAAASSTALGLGDVSVSGEGTLGFIASATDALTLEIGGNLLLGPGGTLSFRLFEEGSGDQIFVNSDTLLNGRISLTLMGGYQPEKGDSFTLLTSTGSLTLGTLLISPIWTTSIEEHGDGSTSLVVTAVPEPGTVWLLLSASALTAGFLRARGRFRRKLTR